MNATEYRNKFLALFPEHNLPQNIVFYWLFVYYCRIKDITILLKYNTKPDRNMVLSQTVTVLSEAVNDIAAMCRAGLFITLSFTLFIRHVGPSAIPLVLMVAAGTQVFLTNTRTSWLITRLFERKIHPVKQSRATDFNECIYGFTRAINESGMRRLSFVAPMRAQVRDSVDRGDFPRVTAYLLSVVDTPAFNNQIEKESAVREITWLRDAMQRSAWINYLWITCALIMFSCAIHPDMPDLYRLTGTVAFLATGFFIVMPYVVPFFFLRCYDDLIDFIRSDYIPEEKNSMNT